MTTSEHEDLDSFTTICQLRTYLRCDLHVIAVHSAVQGRQPVLLYKMRMLNERDCEWPQKWAQSRFLALYLSICIYLSLNLSRVQKHLLLQ